MPTALGDPADLALSDIYYQWALNLGVTPTSKGLGELLGLIASAGAAQSAQGTTDLSPLNTVATNLSRTALTSQTIAFAASGTIQLEAVYLTRGQVITNINWVSGNTAAVGPTNQWGVIANSARVVQAVTTNGLAAAIGANAVITYPMTAPYTVPSTGVYYVGVVVTVATTMPNATGLSLASTIPANQAPIIGGSSTTGLTTPVATGTTLTAITTTAGIMYIYLT